VKNMHNVKLESLATRLIDVDRRIRDNAGQLAKLTLNKADRGQIEAMAGFVRTLFDHRETILREMKKAGLSEADVYNALREEGEKAQYALDSEMAR